jgi:hypothetical protein
MYRGGNLGNFAGFQVETDPRLLNFPQLLAAPRDSNGFSVRIRGRSRLVADSAKGFIANLEAISRLAQDEPTPSIFRLGGLGIAVRIHIERVAFPFVDFIPRSRYFSAGHASRGGWWSDLFKSVIIKIIEVCQKRNSHRVKYRSQQMVQESEMGNHTVMALRVH